MGIGDLSDVWFLLSTAAGGVTDSVVVLSRWDAVFFLLSVPSVTLPATVSVTEQSQGRGYVPVCFCSIFSDGLSSSEQLPVEIILLLVYLFQIYCIPGIAHRNVGRAARTNFYIELLY